MGTSIILMKIGESENLMEALRRVQANKGAPGVDGMTVTKMEPYLREEWPGIRQ